MKSDTVAVDFTKLATNQLILVTGTHGSERRRAVAELLKVVGLDDAGSIDRETIVGGEKPFSDWIGGVSTIPFFADRRAAVIRNIARVDPEELNLSVSELSTLPPSALLILVADDEGSRDQPTSAQASNLKAWEKIVKKHGGAILNFELPKDKDASLIREKARSLGKELNKPTAELLLEMVAGRYDRAEEELEKLALYVGESKQIHQDDLRRSVSAEREYNIWAMLDSMTSGDARTALRQFATIKSQTRDLHGELIKTLAVMGGYFRTIWQARAFVESNGGPEVIRWLPVEKPFTKLSEWQQRKTRNLAQRLNYPTLLACLRILNHASSQLVGQVSSYSSEEVMEQTVLQISALCARPAR